MSSLISPGVSVTLSNQSFYIPASAPTVPLIFLATQANKFQPDGVTPAANTSESGVVRAITSIGQSVQAYGIPAFRHDGSGNQFHGDARNEYGLFALNQFLGVGNLAYVVRANIDLADAAQTFIGVGTPVTGTVTSVAAGNGTISAITATSAFVKPETISVVFTSATAFTVQGSLSGVIGTGTLGASAPVFSVSEEGVGVGIGVGIGAGTNEYFGSGGGTAFTSSKVNFTITPGSVAFVAGDYFQFNLVYVPTLFTGAGNGTMTAISPLASAVAELITVTFTSATAFTASGSVSGPLGTGTVGTTFRDSGNHITFLITAGTVAFVSGNTFTLSLSQVNVFNPLGANDAAKRSSIVTALQAQIVGNTDVLSESYEYNLIVCPGYPEVVSSLLALADNINDEAFVIADTPSTLTPQQTATWSQTTGRASSTNVAYYYPWGQAANLDGTTVVIAPSGIALRTYAFSDNQSYVWFAPAGVSRGVVTGVSAVGYVSGTLGTATTFNQVNLNQGQRDLLYQSYNNINPIAFFPGQGLLIWGQKTSAGAASALDRVAVVRLIMYIRRELRKGAFPFVFEPNDTITRSNLKSRVDGFLNGIMAKRGLFDFVTLCDASNNGADVLANNQMYIYVGLSPNAAAEFIFVPITVYTAGTTLS